MTLFLAVGLWFVAMWSLGSGWRREDQAARVGIRAGEVRQELGMLLSLVAFAATLPAIPAGFSWAGVIAASAMLAGLLLGYLFGYEKRLGISPS